MRTIALLTAFACASLVYGCGDQASTQEAYAICDGLTGNVGTSSEEAFVACVACHEDCGSDCAAVGAEAGYYACPD